MKLVHVRNKNRFEMPNKYMGCAYPHYNEELDYLNYAALRIKHIQKGKPRKHIEISHICYQVRFKGNSYEIIAITNIIRCLTSPKYLIFWHPLPCFPRQVIDYRLPASMSTETNQIWIRITPHTKEMWHIDATNKQTRHWCNLFPLTGTQIKLPNAHILLVCKCLWE